MGGGRGGGGGGSRSWGGLSLEVWSQIHVGHQTRKGCGATSVGRWGIPRQGCERGGARRGEIDILCVSN